MGPANFRSMPPFRRLRVALVIAVLFTFVGCLDGPAERVQKARAAAAAEDIGAYSLLFTRDSAEVLRRMHETSERTAKRLAYVDSVFALLPSGEINPEVDVTGKRALVLVEGGRSGTTTVRMFQEGGLWVIDGFSLPGLWRPLREPPES